MPNAKANESADLPLGTGVAHTGRELSKTKKTKFRNVQIPSFHREVPYEITYSECNKNPSFFNRSLSGRKKAQVSPELPIFGFAKSPVPNHVIKLLHFAP